MVMWAIPISCGLLFLVGLILLILGLRGRRVDDHPICRKCGFDLFGKPEGSTICSECSADLTYPHAIPRPAVRRGDALRRLHAPGDFPAVGGGDGSPNSADWANCRSGTCAASRGFDPGDAALPNSQSSDRGKLSQAQIEYSPEGRSRLMPPSPGSPRGAI
jgi:hypothetical protein